MNRNGVERRTHLRRACPVAGCEWWQTISWYVGGPDTTEAVPEAFLRMEAEAHLTSAHYQLPPTIFT